MNDLPDPDAPTPPTPRTPPSPADAAGSSAPAASIVDSIVRDALEQADELPELDAVRAEVWASDLVALAAEAGTDGPAAVIAALAEAGGAGPAAALWAIDAVADGVDLADPALEPAPEWADDLLTSTCEAAWVLSDWRGASAAFRFVDAADDRHVVVLDFVPGGGGDPETIGEATVGPAELLDAVADAETKLSSEPVPAPELAARVAAAGRATSEPTPSFVAIGRLVIARLSTLGVEDLAPPVWVEPEVPELPPRDAEDEAWAADVLRRALGLASSGEAAEPSGGLDRPELAGAVAAAAATLREAAAADDPLAQWLAASGGRADDTAPTVGPVDLDESDADVLTAALAATLAPATLGPLAADARQAVVELEFADWLGAVIGLVRAGADAPVDPDGLVDHVNRCPEVTTTIPKADRARVAWAFGVVTEPWEPLGLVVDGRLTDLGVHALPVALLAAWAPR